METWLMIFAAICVLLLFLLVTSLILFLYSGVFHIIDVKAGQPPIGKVTIAYKFARGAYQEVGPLFTEVAQIAPDHKAIGIYYDDPGSVSPQHCRYAVASILAEKDQEVDVELVEKFEAEGFKIFELPQVEYAMRSSFPNVSFLSCIIGARRVYPRMSEYAKKYDLEAFPYIEIYDGSEILYMAPLDKQESFFVPEALQKSAGEEPCESVPSGDKGDSKLTDNDEPEAESLLHPSQIVQVIGQAEVEKSTTVEDAEEEEKMAAEGAEGKQEASEVKKESDEESASSFEDLKLDAEQALEADKPQSQ